MLLYNTLVYPSIRWSNWNVKKKINYEWNRSRISRLFVSRLLRHFNVVMIFKIFFNAIWYLKPHSHTLNSKFLDRIDIKLCLNDVSWLVIAFFPARFALKNQHINEINWCIIWLSFDLISLTFSESKTMFMVYMYSSLYQSLIAVKRLLHVQYAKKPEVYLISHIMKALIPLLQTLNTYCLLLSIFMRAF